MLVVVVHSFLYLNFIFDLHFVVVLHLSMFFIHICFASTSSLTLPWTISGFLHPFYTSSPAHRRAICDTFIFNHSVIFLPRALRFWEGIFYPQAFFTLRSFPTFWHNLLLSRLPWQPAVIHTDPRNTDPAHLFVWFTVIHNLHIQNDSVLNSTIYYHELLVVKV